MNKINKNTTDTCGKLREIHMSQDLGVDFTREKFDEIIGAAEAERVKAYSRRKMIRAAIVCLLIGVVCSSLLFGLRTWENATAENDDKTRIVEQSGNLIIGSGIVGGDETVGVTVEEYASIDDLPEDIKEKAHFISDEGFVVERIRVTTRKEYWNVDTYYAFEGKEQIHITEGTFIDTDFQQHFLISMQEDKALDYKEISVHMNKQKNGITYFLLHEDHYFKIYPYDEKIEIETILDGLRIV